MLDNMNTAPNTGTAGVGCAGDVVVVDSRDGDDPRRTGRVLEVLTTGGVVHYRVRWDDGSDCILFPGPDARVVPRRRNP
jgi:hypothetical protein